MRRGISRPGSKISAPDIMKNTGTAQRASGICAMPSTQNSKGCAAASPGASSVARIACNATTARAPKALAHSNQSIVRLSVKLNRRVRARRATTRPCGPSGTSPPPRTWASRPARLPSSRRGRRRRRRTPCSLGCRHQSRGGLPARLRRRHPRPWCPQSRRRSTAP